MPATGKVLLTGASGFLGSHLVEKILCDTDWEIYSLERLNVRPYVIDSPRIHRIHHDFRAEIPTRILKELDGVKYVIHSGAEVHGLRSLEDPHLFVNTNVMGTLNLLEAARYIRPEKFIYISSAEAVGSAPAPLSWDENVTLRPSNPYAAAKAAGEMLVRSYHQSFNVPAISVRTMNIFGERQDTSKFLPATIKKILNHETVKCHVDKEGSSGSRHWIYVRVLADGIVSLLTQGKAGETYHIVGPEIHNNKIIKVASHWLETPVTVEYIEPGPSHDMRYSIKDTKLSKKDYNTDSTSNELVHTIMWYKMHPEYLQ